MLQQQIAAGGPPHFVGPLFSGANAACSYLPLQLTLRPFVIGVLLVLFGTGMDGQVCAGFVLFQPIGFEGLNLDIYRIFHIFIISI